MGISAFVGFALRLASMHTPVELMDHDKELSEELWSVIFGKHITRSAGLSTGEQVYRCVQITTIISRFLMCTDDCINWVYKL